MAKKKAASPSKALTKSDGKGVPKVRILEKEVRIERVIPEGQKAVYANHFVLQAEQSVFHLLCFQVNAPMLIGSPEEVSEMASRIESVKGECVSHVIIPAHQMEALISAMQENVAKHMARIIGQININDLVANGTKGKE